MFYFTEPAIKALASLSLPVFVLPHPNSVHLFEYFCPLSSCLSDASGLCGTTCLSLSSHCCFISPRLHIHIDSASWSVLCVERISLFPGETEHCAVYITSVVLPVDLKASPGLMSCEIQDAPSVVNGWNPSMFSFWSASDTDASAPADILQQSHPSSSSRKQHTGFPHCVLRLLMAGCCIFNVVFFFSFQAAEFLIDLPWPWGAYDHALPPEHRGPEIFRPGSCCRDSCSRLPHLKVNNTPAVTPSRDGITSMNLAAGKLRSDIQFVCICIVLWCFWWTCEICNSFLKPVCCLERAEFQLQLQISLKGKAFKSSDRAARCQLPLSHNQMGHSSILSSCFPDICL